MQEELIGWAGIIIAAFVTFVLSALNKSVALVLVLAFVLRTVAVLVHYYVHPLPDGVADAVTFEQYAWNWAEGGFGSALSYFPGVDSYFYSWLMSLVYAVVGRSLLLLQSISLLVGVLCVYAVYRLGELLWGQSSGKKAALLLAIFPSVIQYSALPMRESWVVLFLLVGLFFVVCWARTGSMSSFFLGGSAFLVATFFHGGMFVAALAFLGIVFARYVNDLLGGIRRGRVSIAPVLVVFFMLSVLVFYTTSGVSIPKLGTALDLVNPGVWMEYFQNRVYGDARYPAWIQPDSYLDLIWAVPVRAIYLLFSPFPWDLHRLSYLIGFLDALFYVYIVVIIFVNRRLILADPAARSMLLVIFSLVVAFGVGTGNFGTAIRHRAKLVAGLIVLASPWVGSRRGGGLPRDVVGKPGIKQ